MSSHLELLDLADLLPGWPTRRIHTHFKKGSFPGAVRVGHSVLISRANFERWTSGGSPSTPSEADAERELRRRGVIA